MAESKYEEVDAIADIIRELEYKSGKFEQLLGEILTSLLADDNAQYFEKMPPLWQSTVENWHSRYCSLKKKNKKVVAY